MVAPRKTSRDFSRRDAGANEDGAADTGDIRRISPRNRQGAASIEEGARSRPPEPAYTYTPGPAPAQIPAAGDCAGDWIGAHTRAFAAAGSVSRLIVPNNHAVDRETSRDRGEAESHEIRKKAPTAPPRWRAAQSVENGLSSARTS